MVSAATLMPEHFIESLSEAAATMCLNQKLMLSGRGESSDKRVNESDLSKQAGMVMGSTAGSHSEEEVRAWMGKVGEFATLVPPLNRQRAERKGNRWETSGLGS